MGALRILAAFLVLSFAAPATAQTDNVSRIGGVWEMVNANGSSGCDGGQTFTVSPDGRYVDMIERDGAEVFQTRYIVLQAQANRILMFIEDEERVTTSGDPVIWWAVFDSPDTFRWRRYDWAATSVTAAQWRRCPTA